MKNEEQESEEDFRLGKNKRLWIFIIVLVVFLLWGASWIFACWYFPDWQTRSNFGEMFGAVNAIFSGVALAGVVYAILLQQDELRLQRLELQLTRKELSRAAEAQEKSEKALSLQAEALAHQIRASMMPMLMVDIVRDHGEITIDYVHDSGLRLRLTNEGNGTAINVKVDDIQMPLSSSEPLPDDLDGEICDAILNRKDNRNITFETISFIKPKASAIVKHISRYAREHSKFDFLPSLSTEDRTSILQIKFDDIEGNHYEQTCQMGKGGYKLGPVKLVGLPYDESQGIVSTRNGEKNQ